MHACHLWECAQQPASCTDAAAWLIPFHPRWLASGGTDGIATLWDMDDIICVKTFLRPDQPVRSVGFSHDASWLAYGTEDNMLDIMSTQTGGP